MNPMEAEALPLDESEGTKPESVEEGTSFGEEKAPEEEPPSVKTHDDNRNERGNRNRRFIGIGPNQGSGV